MMSRDNRRCQHCDSQLHGSGHPRDFGECSKCGLLYFYAAKSEPYQEQYFTKDYERQYGRTYLQDKSNIEKLNGERLKFLQQSTKFDSLESPRVLEVGCAMGFFLQNLTEHFPQAMPEGIEISPFATAQVPADRHFKIYNQSFEDFFKNSRRNIYSVVCAFFVFEHFANQRRFLEQVHSLLLPGGFFFFAVPSLFGPSFKYNRLQWYQDHPTDHFVDYSPSSLKKILGKYGFGSFSLRVPSFHPKRLPAIKYPLRMGFLRSFYKWLFRITNFGDTIECIAVKTTVR